MLSMQIPTRLFHDVKYGSLTFDYEDGDSDAEEREEILNWDADPASMESHFFRKIESLLILLTKNTPIVFFHLLLTDCLIFF